MAEVSHVLDFSRRYAHLDRILVARGETIDRNKLLGATGGETGPHLHYELRHGGEAIDLIAFILRANELYHHLG